jgi:LacI family transcriptional regulator
MRDVAQAAGVSAMTVSNVLNGRRGRVSPATVSLVEDAIARLGYVPDGAARALSARSSGIVALVYRGGGDRPALANPHDSELVGEVERWVSRSGRHLMIHAADDVVTTAGNLRTWNVDGAILVGVLAPQVAELRRLSGVPMVLVDTADDGFATVGVDDVGGGRLAGDHLAGLGHRRTAFVGPDPAAGGVIADRFRGWREALAAHGAGSDDRVLRTTSSSFEAGLDAATRLLAAPELPTAVFCTADILAIGLLKGLLGAGVRVPEDVSVIGFDDLPECRHLTPTLTTVRQDVPAKARSAVDLLTQVMGRAADAVATAPPRATLPVELVLRETVAPPRPDAAPARGRSPHHPPAVDD